MWVGCYLLLPFVCFLAWVLWFVWFLAWVLCYYCLRPCLGALLFLFASWIGCCVFDCFLSLGVVVVPLCSCEERSFYFSMRDTDFLGHYLYEDKEVSIQFYKRMSRWGVNNWKCKCELEWLSCVDTFVFVIVEMRQGFWKGRWKVFSFTVWMGEGKKWLLFFFIQMESVVNEVDLELV
jgi:hypothetical protein